jgi:hypothetical protein
MFGSTVWDEELEYLMPLNVFFILFLALDILLVPLKAYYEWGFLITNKTDIFNAYMRIRFWLDLLSLFSIALPYIIQDVSSNWAKVFFIIYRLYALNNLDL